MSYLTAKDCNVFRALYEKRFAPVDDISHAFGVASYYKFYYEMDGWKALIDSVFPDYFPINVVQGCLMSVVDFLHDNRSEHCYNVGVDMGRSIIAKVNDVISDYTKRINNTLSSLEGVRSRAEEWLNNHETRLKKLEQATGLPIQIPEFLKELLGV